MDISIIDLHSKFQVRQVDSRLFGGFLEHLGGASYEGVFEATSTHVDPDGFRTAVNVEFIEQESEDPFLVFGNKSRSTFLSETIDRAPDSRFVGHPNHTSLF